MATKLKNGEKKGSSIHNGIKTLIEEQRPDILCFQELKTQNEGDVAFLKTNFPYIYTNMSKIKKGYSGVALLTHQQPEWVDTGFDRYSEEQLGGSGYEEMMMEGRILIAKFEPCIVITVYTPNSQPELARLQERLAWEERLRRFMTLLEEEWELPIILCGDLNVAHKEIDIHNPKGKSKMAGYTKEEREQMELLLQSGFVDSYRHLHPEDIKYTYWSNYAKSRERNVGWRLDYIIVSNSISDRIVEADCLTDYMGSDHCPVVMEITL
uniref:Endonuclease/exonuclease/phosphatase domain-containing protein n=1 Tax=viral metagenome TaxID=1070528 RepID=A0A6C0KL69_9ZZZZ